MALKTILLRKKRSDKQAQLEELRKKIEEIKKREADIAQAIEEAKTDEEKAAVEEAVTETDEAMAKVSETIADVQDELDKIQKELDAAEAAQEAAVEEVTGEASAEEESEDGEARSRRMKGNHMEIREAKQFQQTGRHTYKNVRSILAPATNGATSIGPTGVGGINDPIAGVSGLCDLVKLTDCTGMAAYKVAFVSADPTAAARTDGSALANATDPTFGSVTMTPAILATLTYVSKEIRKQSPLDYEGKVRDCANRALRYQVNKKIVDAVLASSQAAKLALTAASTASTGAALFTSSLLSDIILAYGGDEGVDGAAVLVLNKKDLKAFAAVRGTNEYLPVYSIVPDEANPSAGVIKDNNGLSCRYILCNHVTALADLSLNTTAKNTMFYGSPNAIELGVWGGYDVEVSTDYKFAEGLLTVAGEVSCAAEVTQKNGVVIVTAKKSS